MVDDRTSGSVVRENRDTCERQKKIPVAGVRTVIVAVKLGNASGAKGGRKRDWQSEM